MNEVFASHMKRAPELYARLRSVDPVPVSSHGLANEPGIYALFENGLPVHVGRTRKVRNRLRAHRTLSHNSASFAFKRARRELNIPASYKAGSSRAVLQADEVFGACFRKHVTAVQAMTVQFLRVEDPIDQYFLELYATIELGLPTDEFDTH